VKLARGDVVLLPFPFASSAGTKVRPGVVIQCDDMNGRLANTVVVQVTTNIRFVGREPSHVLVDPSTPDGSSSGLLGPSSISCANLATIDQSKIIRRIGSIAPPIMAQVDDAVRHTLAI